MQSLIWSQPGETALILALLSTALVCRWNMLIPISFVFFVMFFLFYRVPRIESLGNGIVAPATGTIARIRERGAQVIIEIFLSPLDPHVQIAPIGGIILESEHIQGPDVDARLPTDYRERWITRIRFRDGILSVIQNTGFLARRLQNYCFRGEKVYKGQLIGLIKFGSRVDLCLPRRFRSDFRFQKGDKVRMGESLFFGEKNVDSQI